MAQATSSRPFPSSPLHEARGDGPCPMLPAATAVRGARACAAALARARLLAAQQQQWQRLLLQQSHQQQSRLCSAGQSRGEVGAPAGSSTATSPGGPAAEGQQAAPPVDNRPLFRGPGPKVRAFIFWSCLGMATGYYFHGA
uniref:Uncharacterized protein n=1 Tax=Pyrodinium bahamense TaxID=73915 RepID=A0A7S0FVT2_9DINO